MKLLAAYLLDYWRLIALALVLAAINQIFSLLDPLIFRYVIDQYATRFSEYTTGEFFRGVSLLLAAAVGVAFVSRVAKNFQDYFINVITQRLGARLYSDGIQHSLELPYAVFEDQRSGETLGKLQKVRTDVEKLIAASINTLFTSLVGIIFVMIYAWTVHWLIAPIHEQQPDGTRRLVSRWGSALRYQQVAESIAVTSVFTTLKYYRSNRGLFLDRLLRYARTVPCDPASTLVFQYVSVLKRAKQFHFHPVVEYRVEPRTGVVSEHVLDSSVSVHAPADSSPVHEAARPGTYAPLRP